MEISLSGSGEGLGRETARAYSNGEHSRSHVRRINLPRAPRGDDDFFDPHGLDPFPERGSVHAVTIPDEVARRRFPGERLGDLLGGP